MTPARQCEAVVDDERYAVARARVPTKPASEHSRSHLLLPEGATLEHCRPRASTVVAAAVRLARSLARHGDESRRLRSQKAAKESIANVMVSSTICGQPHNRAVLSL